MRRKKSAEVVMTRTSADKYNPLFLGRARPGTTQADPELNIRVFVVAPRRAFPKLDHDHHPVPVLPRCNQWQVGI
jgi:hypothetical protein